MLDPNFNPYDLLKELERQCLITARNVSELAKNLSQQATLQQQMLIHINQLTEAINRQDQAMTDLHNRVRLLEVAREYEQNKN